MWRFQEWNFFNFYLFQIIEKFFDTRVAAPPYKPNAVSGFGKMLNVPYNVLKDFVQIMKLELVSEYKDSTLKMETVFVFHVWVFTHVVP
jgi:hypothetical protein